MDLLPHTAHMAQTGQARTALCTWPQRRSRHAHNALCAVPDRRFDQAHTALRACLEHGSGHAPRALCAWQDRWPGQAHNAVCAWMGRWGQAQTVLCPSPDRLPALSNTLSTYTTSVAAPPMTASMSATAPTTVAACSRVCTRAAHM